MANNKRVRIAALVEHENHVCCRYRIRAFQEALALAGIDLDIFAIPQGVLGRVRFFRTLSHYDGVIVQRVLLPRTELTLLRYAAKFLIFDFDDAVWLRDSYSIRGMESRKRFSRFRAMIRACDLIVAGNAFLAESAKQYTQDERIIRIPTCIEPSHYPLSHHDRAKIRLVWVGSSSTLKGLERFRPTLEAIGKALSTVSLRVICDRFPEFQHLEVEQVTWDADNEAQAIAECDIGMSWIPDDDWSRGKCGLKVLQYQAAGLPVVANPVGVHRELVRNDFTGFQADSTEQWIQAIARLNGDTCLRQRLGMAGRTLVEQEYSVNYGAKRWIKALTDAMIQTVDTSSQRH